MKAVLKLAPERGSMAFQDIDHPGVPASGEALIRIDSVGICGTDVAIWQWHEAVVGQYRPSFPLVVGHEFCGTIEATGGVSALPLGTLVAVNPQIACGVCYYCRIGKATLCYDRKLMGGRINGGWSEYVRVPMDNLHALPAGVNAAIAPLMEPLAVAVHAVCERVAPVPGDRIAVIGAGPIGILTLIVAKAAGAREVLVTGLSHDKPRLALVRSLGGIPINVEEEDPVDAARKLQHDGVDIVYETSGAAVALDQAATMVRRAGRICLIGLCHAQATLRSTPLVLREIELLGSRGYNHATWDLVVKLLPQVAAEVERVVSHQVPMSDYQRALDLVSARDGCKIILRPS